MRLVRTDVLRHQPRFKNTLTSKKRRFNWIVKASFLLCVWCRCPVKDGVFVQRRGVFDISSVSGAAVDSALGRRTGAAQLVSAASWLGTR